jgi:hypothetical protein
MSLEQEIRHLQDAIRDLIKALETTDVRSAPASTAERLHLNDKAEPRPITETIDYVQDIQKPALALVQAQGRDALARILATFGARTAKEVPPERWAELSKAIAAVSA